MLSCRISCLACSLRCLRIDRTRSEKPVGGVFGEFGARPTSDGMLNEKRYITKSHKVKQPTTTARTAVAARSA